MAEAFKMTECNEGYFEGEGSYHGAMQFAESIHV